MNYREVEISSSRFDAGITWCSKALYFKAGNKYKHIDSIDVLMELKSIGVKIYWGFYDDEWDYLN